MKKEIELNDDELKAILKNKLKKDPLFYLDFLKRIINKIPGTISDNVLFELLKPSFTKRPTLDKIFYRKPLKPKDPFLRVSPESIDMLFYPQIRRKLKEWQQTFFDKTLPNFKRENAKGKIQMMFNSLTYKGSGREEDLSPENKRNIRNNFRDIDRKCKHIFKKTKRNLANRKLSIKEKFPDVGEQIVNCREIPKSPEKLRNEVFAKRFNCSIRSIEECIREFNLIKTSKLLSDPKVKSLRIKGSGKKADISVERKQNPQ